MRVAATEQPMLLFADLRGAGIYLIHNQVTGKRYVGSATDLAHRWAAHRSKLNQGCHHNRFLQRAWLKYGADAFTITVLEYVANREDLLRREQYWLDALRPFGRRGYNIARLARSPNLGRRMSVAARRKLSERSKGNQYNLGRKRPPRPAAWREKHGKTIRGSRNPFSRLTEEQVRDIKGLLAQYDAMPRPRPRGHPLSIYKIAERFGVSCTLVNDIHSGRVWGWLGTLTALEV